MTLLKSCALMGMLALHLPAAKAAPCCSAGSALPALVTNDDLAQVSVMHAYADTVMDAVDHGSAIARSDANVDVSQLTRISGAWKFAERWQFGAGTSLLARRTEISGRTDETAGFADSDVSVGYEILPEWTYSEWRPRGFLYFQAVFPTGRAIQDPSLRNPADVRGQGVYQTVVGSAFTKAFGNTDVFAVPEVRRLYGRKFGASTELSGTWGAGMLMGVGYSPPRTNFRFGLRTQPVVQGVREVTARNQITPVPLKMVWNSGLDASYLFRDRWLASFAYSDQTLIGPAKNTTLERSVAVALQHRWEP